MSVCVCVCVAGRAMDISQIYRLLCNDDPTLRGHSKGIVYVERTLQRSQTDPSK